MWLGNCLKISIKTCRTNQWMPYFKGGFKRCAVVVHPKFTKILQKGAIDSLLPQKKKKKKFKDEFTPQVCQLLKNRWQLIKCSARTLICCDHPIDAFTWRTRPTTLNRALDMVTFKSLGVQYNRRAFKFYELEYHPSPGIAFSMIL